MIDCQIRHTVGTAQGAEVHVGAAHGTDRLSGAGKIHWQRSGSTAPLSTWTGLADRHPSFLIRGQRGRGEDDPLAPDSYYYLVDGALAGERAGLRERSKYGTAAK